ncbi:MAG: hypothetical protein M1814_006063 [Vezdaea aestivalis]|nr:MAG: hypothetical protein M1814_006063 [Vezdaea aestivalis]
MSTPRVRLALTPDVVPTCSRHLSQQHPRRRSQELSVSLKQSPHSKDPSQQPSTIDPAASFVPQASQLKTSYSSVNNETDGTSNNAESWFANSNERGKGQVSFDEDPPFYLEGHSPSSDRLSACAVVSSSPARVNSRPAYSLPVRAATSKMESSNDSDDFRSVIDDLTIENKKLKQRLRRFERSHAGHLDDDKLFEVKIHHLPPHKRQALEEALRAFTEALEQPTKSTDSSKSGRVQETVSNVRSGENPSSPSASGSRPLDSAYASMSAFAMTSNQPLDNTVSGDSKPDLGDTKAKPDTVQSYLQEIPQGFLPRHPPVMTEKAKKKLVVRRLEQLFTGKDSDKAEHSHPIQQQEVSQSAAFADRTAKFALGQRVTNEGSREAQMFHPRVHSSDPESHLQEATQRRDHHTDSESQDDRQWKESLSGEDNSPEQRPTRPLDLDPHRAQNAVENIDYIRHLGVSSPKLSLASDASDEGWVYLNLLTNMAQLHTINVTPEFVRKAVTEVSSQLELSRNGREIRWRGGNEGSKWSSDSGSSGGPLFTKKRSSFDNANLDERVSKRQKTGRSSNDEITQNMASSSSQAVHAKRQKSIPGTRRPVPTSLRKVGGHHYEPLFFYATASDEGEGSVDMDADSGFSSDQRDTNLPRSADVYENHNNKQAYSAANRNNDGSLIFYRKSTFCTDLTGDVAAIYMAATSRKSVAAVGRAGDLSPIISSSSVMEDYQGDSAMELDLSPSDEPALSFPSPAFSSTPGQSTPDAKFFEVSGLGGVQPADNFVLHVTTSYPIHSNQTSKSQYSRHFRSKARAFHHRIPDTALAAFHDVTPKSLTPTTIQTKYLALEPSTLPPPSYAAETSADSDSDSDSIHPLDAPTSDGNTYSISLPVAATCSDSMGPPRLPASKLRKIMSSVGTTGSSSLFLGDSVSRDTDSEIDLLAAARKVDPVTIAEREREFDNGLGKRFTEELPAGSSAATAGGGSGWDSGGERWRGDEADVNAWGQRM